MPVKRCKRASPLNNRVADCVLHSKKVAAKKKRLVNEREWTTNIVLN